jgi:hypothetical protein
MQRALGVGMSLVCLYIGGMAGGVVPSVEGGTTGSTGRPRNRRVLIRLW